ncbi:hypothetical protein [Mesorhizobium sp.]|uniref:hypothetical protein n=1 Tax=Mesorhizobium sp. TaxID=1871066 RepID=UPI000FE81D03|nr:hypothetical protein [Mesorhizobium sp.]RWO57262.1 MAG: hypothetical protein EOS14_23655 [Mesorhizobium sp.]
MTPAQKELARHALGLPNRQRRSYRNHFVTGEGGSDHREWMALVEAGHAWRRAGSQLRGLTGGDDLFRLTRAGAELALEKRERLNPEDFPKVPA